MDRLHKKPILATAIIIIGAIMVVMYLSFVKDSVGAPGQNVTNFLDNLEAQQIAYQQANGRFEYREWTVFGDYRYRVDEYNSPDGLGYRVWVRQVTPQGDLQEMHRVYGAEAQTAYQYDWTTIFAKTATYTPSILDEGNI